MGRLREPSTWAGLASLANGVAKIIEGDYSGETWALVGGGLAAIFMKEKAHA